MLNAKYVLNDYKLAKRLLKFSFEVFIRYPDHTVDVNSADRATVEIGHMGLISFYIIVFNTLDKELEGHKIDYFDLDRQESILKCLL